MERPNIHADTCTGCDIGSGCVCPVRGPPYIVKWEHTDKDGNPTEEVCRNCWGFTLQSMQWIRTRSQLKQKLKAEPEFKEQKFKPGAAARVQRLAAKAQQMGRDGWDLGTCRIALRSAPDFNAQFTEDECAKVVKHSIKHKDSLVKKALFIEEESYRRLVGDPALIKPEPGSRPGPANTVLSGFYSKYDIHLLVEEGVYEASRSLEDCREIEQVLLSSHTAGYEGAVEDNFNALCAERCHDPTMSNLKSVGEMKQRQEDEQRKIDAKKIEREAKKLKTLQDKAGTIEEPEQQPDMVMEPMRTFGLSLFVPSAVTVSSASSSSGGIVGGPLPKPADVPKPKGTKRGAQAVTTPPRDKPAAKSAKNDPGMLHDIATELDEATTLASTTVSNWKSGLLTKDGVREVGDLITKLKTATGAYKRVCVHIPDGYTKSVYGTDIFNALSIIQSLLRLQGRKPNHPVTSKELTEITNNIESHTLLQSSMPEQCKKWMTELKTINFCKAADYDSAVAEIMNIQGDDNFQRQVAEAGVKALINVEKDQGQDLHKDLKNGLIEFFSRLPADKFKDGDVAAVRTVRIAAFFCQHAHRLGALREDPDAADLMKTVAAMAPDAVEDEPLRILLQRLQTNAKEPGYIGLAKAFGGGTSGMPRATHMLNRANIWSIILTKLKMLEGQTRNMLRDITGDQGFCASNDVEVVKTELDGLSQPVFSKCVHAMKEFVAKQFADSKKPPNSSDHFLVLDNLDVAGKTVDGILLCKECLLIPIFTAAVKNLVYGRFSDEVIKEQPKAVAEAIQQMVGYEGSPNEHWKAITSNDLKLNMTSLEGEARAEMRLLHCLRQLLVDTVDEKSSGVLTNFLMVKYYTAKCVLACVGIAMEPVNRKVPALSYYADDLKELDNSVASIEKKFEDGEEVSGDIFKMAFAAGDVYDEAEAMKKAEAAVQTVSRVAKFLRNVISDGLLVHAGDVSKGADGFWPVLGDGDGGDFKAAVEVARQGPQQVAAKKFVAESRVQICTIHKSWEDIYDGADPVDYLPVKVPLTIARMKLDLGKAALECSASHDAKKLVDLLPILTQASKDIAAAKSSSTELVQLAGAGCGEDGTKAANRCDRLVESYIVFAKEQYCNKTSTAFNLLQSQKTAMKSQLIEYEKHLTTWDDEELRKLFPDDQEKMSTLGEHYKKYNVSVQRLVADWEATNACRTHPRPEMADVIDVRNAVASQMATALLLQTMWHNAADGNHTAKQYLETFTKEDVRMHEVLLTKLTAQFGIDHAKRS